MNSVQKSNGRKVSAKGIAQVFLLNSVSIAFMGVVFLSSFAFSASASLRDIVDAASDALIGVFTAPQNISSDKFNNLHGVDSGISAASLSAFAELRARKERENIERDRLAGLLSRLLSSVEAGRREDAVSAARQIEALTDTESVTAGFPALDTYRYLAKAVVRLAMNSDAADYAGSLEPLKAEIRALQAENERYRKNIADAESELQFAQTALSLQDSNAQIQEMLLGTLKDEYEKSQQTLSEVRSQIETGAPLSSIEAQGYTLSGYTVGVKEARDMLERALRIRSRDGRIEYLKEARTRYNHDQVMAAFIDTLLDRL